MSAPTLAGASTLLLNASYEILCYIPTRRAVTLLLDQRAALIAQDGDRVVRSQFLVMPWPTVVAIKRYVLVPHRRRRNPDYASHADILRRDHHRCVYCGRRATTVDHVLPRSRGGADTWGNLVAACFACNNRKGDRTPEEAGMVLRHQPGRPDDASRLQEWVWELVGA